MRHTWTEDGVPVPYDCCIVDHHANSDEFELKSSVETEPYFMSHAEVLADIMRGDMVVKE